MAESEFPSINIVKIIETDKFGTEKVYANYHLKEVKMRVDNETKTLELFVTQE